MTGAEARIPRGQVAGEHFVVHPYLMDETLLQSFALATSLVSAVAAVLAFSQSGWRSTVRATVLVLGAGGVAYMALIPQKSAPASGTAAACLPGPGPAEQSTALRRSDPSSTLCIPSAVQPVPADAPAPVVCIPAGGPSAGFNLPPGSLPVAMATPLPARYPSVYSAAEVLECPYCHKPYSASGCGRGVKCPACNQVVDLVPAGPYFTVHCCCGNWIKSPYKYHAAVVNGTSLPVYYFCPRCGAQGTIAQPAAGGH